MLTIADDVCVVITGSNLASIKKLATKSFLVFNFRNREKFISYSTYMLFQADVLDRCWYKSQNRSGFNGW
jgi:hypothetical protein